MKKIIIFLLVLNFSVAFDLNSLKHMIKTEVSGDFNQSKILKNFANPLLTNGKFELKNGIFVQETLNPINLKIKVSKDGIFEFNGKEFIKTNALFDKNLFLSILNIDINALKKDFEASLSGDEKAWILELTPKGILAKIFEKITIFGDSFIKALILIEKNGDTTKYEFFNLK